MIAPIRALTLTLTLVASLISQVPAAHGVESRPLVHHSQLSTARAQVPAVKPVVETQHSIYASVKASSDTDWQGTVTFDHTVTFQGRRQLRHSNRAEIQLWRRFCDLGGCVETDVSVSESGLPRQVWQPDLSKGSVSIPVVTVHINRYRVLVDEYRKIDSSVVRVPLTLTVSRTADKFQQALVANTPTLSTTSVTRQVSGTIHATLGELSVDSVQATASAAVITTMIRR
jgi:hypothetical protein